MDNGTAKDLIVNKLKISLIITSRLTITPQQKLKFLLFEIKIYDFPLDWIDANLDALCTHTHGPIQQLDLLMPIHE